MDGQYVKDTASSLALQTGVDSLATRRSISQSVKTIYTNTALQAATVTAHADMNPGTGNFSLRWKGAVSDWTPSDAAFLFFNKITGTTGHYYGYQFLLYTSGLLKIYVAQNSAFTAYSSSRANSITDGSDAEIVWVVTRETASVAGSIAIYINGYLWDTIVIPTGTPISWDSAGDMKVSNHQSISTSSETGAATYFTYALTAAQVLSIYQKGVDFSDKNGSYTALSSDTAWTGASGATPPTGWTKAGTGTASFSIVDLSGVANMTSTSLQFAETGGVNYVEIYKSPGTVGKKHRLKIAYRYNQAGATAGVIKIGSTIGSLTLTNTGLSGDGIVATIDCGVATTTQIELIIRAGDTLQIAYVYSYPDGVTLSLEPEGAQRTKWFNSGTVGMDGAYPVAGTSLIRAFTPPVTMTRSFIISNPSAGNSPLWRVPYGVTVLAVHVLCVGGTNIVGQVWHYDTNGASGSAIDSADITGTAGTNVNDDGALSSPNFLIGEYMGWSTTSVSGVVTRAIITVDYKLTY